MRTLTAALALGGIVLMATSTRAGNLAPATEELLQSSSYIYVATQRQDGELGSFSPIWFMYVDGKLFFTTSPTSWKAKRIAAGSPLYIWVGAEDGPFLEGTAEPVTDAAFIDRMGARYAEKYWIAWLGLFKPRSTRVADGRTVAYLVTPTRVAADAAPASPRDGE